MRSDRVTAKKSARRAGLTYINGFEGGIKRLHSGKGFRYETARGGAVKSQRTLTRIEAIVIPPAWKDVWICTSASGHIQARGRDEAGRLQSIYHPKWQEYCSSQKYDGLLNFAKHLPKIRRRVMRDLKSSRQPTKSTVLAAIVKVLDIGHIRIGNVKYERERKSYGATTLKRRHAEVHGVRVSLDFPGKSGQRSEVEFESAPVAKVIRACEALKGQYLFSYLNEEGKLHKVTSTEVNEYLDEIAQADISAKDFRTWWGCTYALNEFLASYDDSSEIARKKSIVRAVTAASEELGNTKAVCRSSYIHSGMLAAAEDGKLTELLKSIRRSKKNVKGFSKAECMLVSLLGKL